MGTTYHFLNQKTTAECLSFGNQTRKSVLKIRYVGYSQYYQSLLGFVGGYSVKSDLKMSMLFSFKPQHLSGLVRSSDLKVQLCYDSLHFSHHICIAFS